MYNISMPILLEKLSASLQGLSSGVADKLLVEHGPNELLEKKKIPVWLLFFLLRKFIFFNR
jgi:Ca2+-transporting ATPase